MKTTSEMKNMTFERKSERGAALVSMLLLSMLLLTAGGALILTTTLSATNAIDSTAEMQAYYGAEAGLQSTINVLRGNVWKGAGTPAVNFRTAVEPSASNAADDPATDENVARLSNWLGYTDTDTYPSRVIANGENGANVIAYDVTAKDVDDSKNVRYSTSATIAAEDSGCTVAGTAITCANGSGNSFTLTYTAQAATTLNAYPSAASALGSFRLTVTGNGATIPAGKFAWFKLKVNQTLPWAAYDTVNAKIAGNVTGAASNLTIDFLGKTAKVDGTSYALCGTCDPLSINHPTTSGGVTSLTSTITAPQPKRILVRSTGYGPKGAVKRLEMVMTQSVFDFDAPAVLTVRGSDNGTAMTFDIGSSNAKTYSGADHAGAEIQLPTFAVSGSDVTTADEGIKKESTVADPEIGYLDNSTIPSGVVVPTIQVETPDFLKTAKDARDALSALQTTAYNMGNYHAPASGTEYTVSASNTTATGVTFVDGDCNLDGGSGLLVVTGKLNMKGNPNFSGVILVLGSGVVERDGGGNGNVYGAMVVAKFDRTSGDFGAPSFKTNGGGTSLIQYDSLAVSRALGAIGAAPGGIREY
jgi:hypothetical protein